MFFLYLTNEKWKKTDCKMLLNLNIVYPHHQVVVLYYCQLIIPVQLFAIKNILILRKNNARVSISSAPYVHILRQYFCAKNYKAET